jgi:shikimate dehydrogenase
MHNAAFAALKLDFTYLPFEVSPGALREAVNAVGALGLRGVNVTIPHKESVLRFLDEVDPLARRIGSVNTIVNKNGVLKGYNTDATGFIKDLKNNGFNPSNTTVIIVGAGGAGRAVAAALNRAGAKKIFITDMLESRAKSLASNIKRAEFISFRAWKGKIEAAGLLVNATPAGMRPGKPLAAAKELTKEIFVYDLVYNRRTELLNEAVNARARCAGGLGMLLNQGAAAFELWTGKKAPLEIMRKALIKNFPLHQRTSR